MSDKMEHYMTIKESIVKEDVTILKMYMSNKRSSKYLRQKLKELQGEIGKYSIKVGDFNTLLFETDISSRQKISKGIVELNSTINQLVLIDIYRILLTTVAEYMSSQAHLEPILK